MKSPILNSQFSILALILMLAISVSAGPVSNFGALKVCKIGGKGYLCGEKTGTSTKVQIKGASLFWHSSEYGPIFWNPEVVDWFVDNMQIAVIRAPMGVRYDDNMQAFVNITANLGYYDDPATSKRMVKNIVDAAIANDIYVIVDWHSPDAHNETELAKGFFKEMATEYKGVPNIIWELYNEPHTPGAGTITNYANAVLNEIRGVGNDNLVLIGSQSWSSQPQEQSQNWGTSDNAVTKNVAFTVHFYAATGAHSAYRGNADQAMNNGYAVFSTEWGFSGADGGGNTVAGTEYLTWMDNNTISNTNWNASAKPEGSSMFSSGTNMTNLLAGNATSRLTTSGNQFYAYMTGGSYKKWTDFAPAGNPKGKDVTVSVNDGESVTLTSQLGLSGSKVTAVSQPAEGTASFTDNSVTYTTSQSGTASERVRFKYSITQNNVTVDQRVTVIINNRRIALPQKDPITVSRKTPTTLNIRNAFSPSDPSDPSGNGLSLKEVSLSNPSVGTLEMKGTKKDTLVFTPSSSMANAEPTQVTLSYSIQNASGSFSSATVILKVQNIAPTVNTNNICCLSSKPNTAPIGIGVPQAGGSDKDKDPLTFVKLYLDPRYPGRLEQVQPDSFVYYPEPDKIGKIVMLAVVTDGLLESNLGKTNLTLTGSGVDIGNITPPTEIPGYEPPEQPDPILPVFAGGLAIKYAGSGNLEISFAKSGFAKLDVYSLSGKNMGTLLSGNQSAGSRTVSLKSLNLQKGVYILRLSQGSQVKTLRVVH